MASYKNPVEVKDPKHGRAITASITDLMFAGSIIPSDIEMRAGAVPVDLWWKEPLQVLYVNNGGGGDWEKFAYPTAIVRKNAEGQATTSFWGQAVIALDAIKVMTASGPDSVIKTLTPWELYETVLMANCSRVLAYGPPGTGKSYSAALWAQRNGWEFLSITLTDQTPMSELRGHFILKGNDFVWHDGIVARAWRMTQSGAKVLIEFNEINEAGQDTETFLHNALDDPAFARLDLPTGETLRPAAGHVINFATMNGQPEHLREALRDRFPVKIELLTPNPAAIEALPADLRDLAKSLTEADDENVRISVRPIATFAELRTKINAFHALQAVFGPVRAKDLAVAVGLRNAGG